MKVAGVPGQKEEDESGENALLEAVKSLRKGMSLPVTDLSIREGETSPAKTV